MPGGEEGDQAIRLQGALPALWSTAAQPEKMIRPSSPKIAGWKIVPIDEVGLYRRGPTLRGLIRPHVDYAGSRGAREFVGPDEAVGIAQPVRWRG